MFTSGSPHSLSSSECSLFRSSCGIQPIKTFWNPYSMKENQLFGFNGRAQTQKESEILTYMCLTHRIISVRFLIKMHVVSCTTQSSYSKALIIVQEIILLLTLLCVEPFATHTHTYTRTFSVVQHHNLISSRMLLPSNADEPTDNCFGTVVRYEKMHLRLSIFPAIQTSTWDLFYITPTSPPPQQPACQGCHSSPHFSLPFGVVLFL